MKKTIVRGIVVMAMMLMGATNMMAQEETTANDGGFSFSVIAGVKPIILMPKHGDKTTLIGGYLGTQVWGEGEHWGGGGSIAFQYAQGGNENSVYGISTKTTTSLFSGVYSADAGYRIGFGSGKMSLTPLVGIYMESVFYGQSKTKTTGYPTTKVKLKSSKQLGSHTWDFAAGVEAGVRWKFCDHCFTQFKYGFGFWSYTKKQLDQRFDIGVGYIF